MATSVREEGRVTNEEDRGMENSRGDLVDGYAGVETALKVFGCIRRGPLPLPGSLVRAAAMRPASPEA